MLSISVNLMPSFCALKFGWISSPDLKQAFKTFWCFWILLANSSGQIIATSHDPKWWFGKGNLLFQGNLGWWNIIIWPELIISGVFECGPNFRHSWRDRVQPRPTWRRARALLFRWYLLAKQVWSPNLCQKHRVQEIGIDYCIDINKTGH